MSEGTEPKTVTYYEPVGEKTYEDWLKRLKDRRARAKIDTRLDRIEEDGHFGNCESAGEGVIELKIDYGPGYRVYIGEEGSEVIVLWGGIKDTQDADIARARRYWQKYKNAKKKP